MSDQQDEPPDERIERVVRAVLVDWGLDALVREVDEVSAEGELTDAVQERTSLARVRALLEAAAAHFRDRAVIAERAQEMFAELKIERAVFIDPEGYERAEVSQAGDWTSDREAAEALDGISRDYFR